VLSTDRLIWHLPLLYMDSLPAMPATVEQLQHECTEHFGWWPCWWQSEIAFKLTGLGNQISISATGSGKSHVFWLLMMYERGLTIIIISLKSLGQQLTDESSREGFHVVSVTTELLGESPSLLDIGISTCLASG